MPFGAYKINAWGGNINDAPVIPVGLTNNSYSVQLATIVIKYPDEANYNNQIAVLGGNNGRVYFAMGYGGATASYTSLATANLTTGVTTISNTSSNTSLGNNEVACYYAYARGNLQSNGLVISTWNQNATPTEIRNNSVYVSSAWQTNGAGTTYAGGNTTLGIQVATNYNKGKASAVTGRTGQTDSLAVRWIGVSHNAGTNYIDTFSYNSTAGFTQQANLTNVLTYNIENGVRLCGFTDLNLGISKTIYIGYSSSNVLYLGSIYVSGTTTINQSSSSLGISYTTKNAMIKTLSDIDTTTKMAVIQHSDQYLRFVKCTAFGSSFNPTQSQDFLISDTPNSWYRVCATGIDELGALVYYVDTEGSFYIKFFSIDSNFYSIIWGEPIFLQANPISNLVLMNADVKYFSFGFSVGIFISDGNTDNRCLMNVLWNQTQRPFSNIDQQNSYKLATNTTSPNFANLSAPILFPPSDNRCFYVQGAGTAQSLTPTILNNVNYYNIGTGDFTIEYWLRHQILTTALGNREESFRLNATNYISIANIGGVIQWNIVWDGNTINSTTPTLTTNTWYHIAAVRESGTISFYVNGTLIGSISNSTNYDTANYTPTIGNAGGANSALYGITELRFSNIARYTGSSFTPPTYRFVNDVNTVSLIHLNSSVYHGMIVDDCGPGYNV